MWDQWRGTLLGAWWVFLQIVVAINATAVVVVSLGYLYIRHNRLKAQKKHDSVVLSKEERKRSARLIADLDRK